MTLYERILEVISEMSNDPELGIDLPRAQLETLSEIVADEITIIIRETKEKLSEQVRNILDIE